MMDILAFHEKYLLRPALRSIAFYFSIIAIALVTMVKPAQASGNIGIGFFVSLDNCINIPVYPHTYSYDAFRACVKADKGAIDTFFQNYSVRYIYVVTQNGGREYPVTITYGVDCPSNSTPIGAVTCTCTDPYVPDPTRTSCVADNLTITLSGNSRVSPWNQLKDSKHVLAEANLPYKAIVKDQNGQPKANVSVTITADVKSGTGGHNHDNPRPKGKLVTASADGSWDGKETLTGTTDISGVFAFTFGSEEASGTHTLNATCQGCAEKAKEIEISVLVDRYLEPIPKSMHYTLIDTDGTVIGSNSKHKENHYLTPEAAAILVMLANRYYVEFAYLQKPLKGQKIIPPLPLYLNDASLALGGKFDIFADWSGDHVEHRKGTVIDVRANSKFGAIPVENFDDFIQFANDLGADAGIHSRGKDNQHFHVRLLGRKE